MAQWIQLPFMTHGRVPGKAPQAGPCTWAFAIHVGDHHGVLDDSWLWPGPDMTIVANWGQTNGWELLPSVSLPFK